MTIQSLSPRSFLAGRKGETVQQHPRTRMRAFISGGNIPNFNCTLIISSPIGMAPLHLPWPTNACHRLCPSHWVHGCLSETLALPVSRPTWAATRRARRAWWVRHNHNNSSEKNTLVGIAYFSHPPGHTQSNGPHRST